MSTSTKYTYTLQHHNGQHTTTHGPFTYYECQAAIIGIALPAPFPGHSHGAVFRKAALFMDLITQYNLPELTINISDHNTITIERKPTPCNTSAKSPQSS